MFRAFLMSFGSVVLLSVTSVVAVNCLVSFPGACCRRRGAPQPRLFRSAQQQEHAPKSPPHPPPGHVPKVTFYNKCGLSVDVKVTHQSGEITERLGIESNYVLDCPVVFEKMIDQDSAKVCDPVETLRVFAAAKFCDPVEYDCARSCHLREGDMILEKNLLEATVIGAVTAKAVTDDVTPKEFMLLSRPRPDERDSPSLRRRGSLEIHSSGSPEFLCELVPGKIIEGRILLHNRTCFPISVLAKHKSNHNDYYEHPGVYLFEEEHNIGVDEDHEVHLGDRTALVANAGYQDPVYGACYEGYQDLTPIVVVRNSVWIVDGVGRDATADPVVELSITLPRRRAGVWRKCGRGSWRQDEAELAGGAWWSGAPLKLERSLVEDGEDVEGTSLLEYTVGYGGRAVGRVEDY